MAEPRPSFLASPSRPKLKLPAGACDAHVHVFGPKVIFPFAESRPFTPADAPKEKLFALHAMLGIGHCVIVQSTRSEEHTSELQSPCNLVCRLLLEKKK